jgi:hypothetical protein
MTDRSKFSAFSQEAINAALDRALVSIPEGHSTALVATVAVEHGGLIGKLAFYERINDAWQFGAYIEGGTRAPLLAGAEVRFSK